ncbi:hypothetical protein B0I35DRAFT_414457 [Stachybotrys elegans]|uniref:Alcohol dehydrogenase-like N-terminal domain-containing protein n=1 Tax=Stachybotrys elegans TaxID=80388 RepID=A0A8K0SHM2_9HYPO|nr:hypothetical protein B0I35DRAFT_414457 [Stachybotrys elegans]
MAARHVRPTFPPTLAKGELLVRVRASSLNVADYKVPELPYGMGKMVISVPASPGMDFAGTVVVANKPGVAFAEGDNVFGRLDPYVIVVMEGEPDVPGGGYHRPQRKRTRTARALESDQKKGDMEWQEEESSEGAPSQTRAKKRATPKATGSMIEVTQSLKQLLEQDFNKRMESMRAEFQLEFTKLSDRMAEEVTRATAQMAQELSQVRDHLTQVCGELEQTRLQLDMLNKAETPRSPGRTYADAARMTPVRNANVQ